MMTTIDDLRQAWTDDTRAKLKAQGCPPDQLELHTKAHMDTVTDEAMIIAWQQAGRDIAARKAAEAEKATLYAADLERTKAAAKVTRDHQDRLAHEQDKTAEAEEEVTRTKALLRSSQGQIQGLMKAQGK
jgi:hypothetical protein